MRESRGSEDGLDEGERCRYSRAAKALDELESELQCSVCNLVSPLPCSLGVCDHIFCRNCCSRYLGRDCPVCGIPTYVKDAQIDQQLVSIFAILQELKKTLSKGITGGKYEETGSAADEPITAVLEKMPSVNAENENTTVQKCTRSSRSLDLSNSSTGVLRSSKKRCTRGEAAVKLPITDKRRKLFPTDGVAGKRKSAGTDPNNFGTISYLTKKATLKQKGITGFMSPQNSPGEDRKNNGRLQRKARSFTALKPFTAGSKQASPTVQAVLPHDRRNAKGEYPLHIASIKGDLNKTVMLLDEGANPNIRDHAGWTPLHEACNHGHVRIVEVLLDHGARISAPGMENDTPLHDAVVNYRLDVVRLLVSRGASLTARNIHGKTPMDCAATNDMKEALNTPVTENISALEQDTTDTLEIVQLCILPTALTRDQKIQLQKTAALLHAQVVDNFCPQVTHVVTSCNKQGLCPRTLKYLQAVLMGKWIVNMDWVIECQEYQICVHEEAFEVPGTSTNPASKAAQKGRINRRNQLPGLFDGCGFYFHGMFNYPTPSKDELIELVRCGGGSVLTREPKLQSLDKAELTVPYHAEPGSALANCGLFIIHDSNISHQTIRTSWLCTAPALWIMDCIASFSLVDLPQG